MKLIKDQMRLLDKLRELVDMFENGKEAGLTYGSKEKTEMVITEPKIAQDSVKLGDSDIDIRKATILRRIEDDTQSMRDHYSDRITTELDQMCQMFDEKVNEDLNQLKAELLLNIQHHPDRRAELIDQFKTQARVIEVQNNSNRSNANNQILDKYRDEIKDDLKGLRQKYVQEMKDANLDISHLPQQLFRDEALVTYLLFVKLNFTRFS